MTNAQSFSLFRFLIFESEELKLPKLDGLVSTCGHETFPVRHHVHGPEDHLNKPIIKIQLFGQVWTRMKTFNGSAAQLETQNNEREKFFGATTVKV